MKAVLLALTMLFLASPLRAVDRAPADADRMFQEVGAQMFCVCGGCREGLLDCTMTNCSAKQVQQDFLAELCRDGDKDAPAIRAGMIERFGDKVVQVREGTKVFAVAAIGVVLLVAAFGAGLWFVTRRGVAEELAPATIDPELEARIAAELKELE